jgi:hypothetical protein
MFLIQATKVIFFLIDHSEVTLIPFLIDHFDMQFLSHIQPLIA